MCGVPVHTYLYCKNQPNRFGLVGSQGTKSLRVDHCLWLVMGQLYESFLTEKREQGDTAPRLWLSMTRRRR